MRIHEVELPRIYSTAYLRPVYEYPQFLVRNVWRASEADDGQPDNLPTPPASRPRSG